MVEIPPMYASLTDSIGLMGVKGDSLGMILLPKVLGEDIRCYRIDQIRISKLCQRGSRLVPRKKFKIGILK
jgi:hypothetical protein